MDTKLGKDLTYSDRLPFLKPHDLLITWPTLELCINLKKYISTITRRMTSNPRWVLTHGRKFTTQMFKSSSTSCNFFSTYITEGKASDPRVSRCLQWSYKWITFNFCQRDPEISNFELEFFLSFFFILFIFTHNIKFTPFTTKYKNKIIIIIIIIIIFVICYFGNLKFFLLNSVQREGLKYLAQLHVPPLWMVSYSTVSFISISAVFYRMPKSRIKFK